MPAGYPDGYTFPEGISPNKAEYRGRGWCTCEPSISPDLPLHDDLP